MRALIVSPAFPSDVRVYVHGVFKRLGMFIDAIKEIAQVDMLFYVPPEIDVSPPAVSAFERSLARHWSIDLRLFLCPRNERRGKTSKWRRYGAGIFNFFEQGAYRYTSGARQVGAFEAALKSGPDVIFAHRLPSMCPALLTGQALPKILFDLDDIEHVVRLRAGRQNSDLRENLLSYLHIPMLVWGERRAIRLAYKTFVCSESDRRYLADVWKLPGIVAIHNAVAAAQAQPLWLEPTLLFIGNFLYDPNVQAAKFLIEKIWPRVRDAVPSARLIIAGSRPSRIACVGNGASGIEFTGFVDDLEALYRRSRIVVAPILSGSGTRIKIIEAAAYGKPIVATRIAAEGLEMRDGHELLICDGAESFADACLMLLKRPVLCEHLGCSAHTAAIRYYDRQHVINLIRTHFTDEGSGRQKAPASPGIS